MTHPTPHPGRLGVGIQLPIQAQSRIFVEPWELEAGPESLAHVAAICDRLGYLYVGACDHTVVPAERTDAMGAVWYEPLTTLAWIAAQTSQIRLLTHVYVLGMRHPLLAAKAVATVDRLSRGRLVLGVGAGHLAGEFDALDVPFDDRGGRLDEAIDAVRAALAGATASHEGERFGFRDVAVAPRPVQQPPPVWVGGSSDAALRRAGERGDGWLPQGTPLADMERSVARIRAAAEDADRDPSGIAIGGMPPPLYVGEPDWDTGRHTTAGPPGELVELLDRYAAVGCSHVQVRLRSRSADELVDQLERFAAEVMPELGGADEQ